MTVPDRWQLAKKTRTVRCVESPHPLGLELRVILFPRGSAPNPGSVARGGPEPRSAPWHHEELLRSEVFRERSDADAAATEWRAAFEQKGWQSCRAEAAEPRTRARFRRDALMRALALTRHAQGRVPGDNAMGHVLSYRLKVMREALEVAVDDRVSLDPALREKRLLDAMQELARAERGPEGQAFVKPILEAITGKRG